MVEDNLSGRIDTWIVQDASQDGLIKSHSLNLLGSLFLLGLYSSIRQEVVFDFGA